MEIFNNIEKLLLELRPTLEQLKKQYSYLELSDDTFELLFTKHIDYLKENKSKIKDVNSYFKKTFYITLFDNVKDIYDTNTLLSKFINSNIKIRKTKSENIKELLLFSKFLNQIKFELEIIILEHLVQENVIINSIINNIITKKEITQEELEKYTQDSNVIVLLEVYCSKNEIKIVEERNIDTEIYNINDRTYLTDSVKVYLNEINSMKLLTQEDEYQYAKLAQQGDSCAREKLIKHNLRLVVSIAKRYAGHGMLLLDLIQEGNIGLMTAINKFDPDKGYKLSTYATWWIRQAITRSLAEKARMIRIPVHTGEKYFKILRTTSKLAMDLNREPTLNEVADEMKMSVSKIEEIIRYFEDIKSLHMVIGDEQDSELIDFIGDDKQNIEDDYLNKDLVNSMHDLLNKVNLTPREKRVLELRFGINDGIPRTLEEVSKYFNVTRERIRQIEAKGLRKLRNNNLTKSLAIYTDNPDMALERIKNYKDSISCDNFYSDVFKTGRIGDDKQNSKVKEKTSSLTTSVTINSTIDNDSITNELLSSVNQSLNINECSDEVKIEKPKAYVKRRVIIK